MKYTITVCMKNCGVGEDGFQPGNDCAGGDSGGGIGSSNSGITIPNNGVNENVNTSSWPSAYSKSVVNMNKPEYRTLLRELAVDKKQQVMPKLDEMMGVATSNKFKSTTSQDVYFGLSDFAPSKDQTVLQSLGSRSVTNQLERARQYAGDRGSLFKVTLPVGTTVVNAKVLGIKESVLLPGSKFKIGETKNGVTQLTLQDDGKKFIKDVFEFQQELDAIYEKNKNKKVI